MFDKCPAVTGEAGMDRNLTCKGWPGLKMLCGFFMEMTGSDQSCWKQEY